MDEIISENANFYEKLTACFGDLSFFSQQIQEIASLAGIDLAQYEIDHVALRMNKIETAEAWKFILLTNGRVLNESIVNYRPIILLEIAQGITVCKQIVKIVELPFPKDKVYQNEGWEHIEMVFPMQENELVEQWVSRTMTHFKLAENPALNIKISQPKVEGEQLPNPTIAISVKNATNCNYCCLKIHPYGINKVIESERLD